MFNYVRATDPGWYVPSEDTVVLWLRLPSVALCGDLDRGSRHPQNSVGFLLCSLFLWALLYCFFPAASDLVWETRIMRSLNKL